MKRQKKKQKGYLFLEIFALYEDGVVVFPFLFWVGPKEQLY